MKLTFGYALDGFRPPAGTVALGELTCGPLGMLDWLETRLGLLHPAVSDAQRVGLFRQLLEQAQTDTSRFYSRSFAQDPVAVADTLLGWRDELVLSGWNGSVPAGASVRLRDLAEVESLAVKTLPAGVGDRLRALLRTLDGSLGEIVTVQTVDDPQGLPKLWRLLLARLNVRPNPAPSSDSSGTVSDLSQIQAALSADGTLPKIRLRQDGSILLITAYSEFTLANGVAQWLTKERQSSRTVALLSDHTGCLLENALLDLDEPALGMHAVSKARPIPQVLPLALRLHWKPLDPRHLLEFLTHPVCPVSGLLRFRLARALQDSPGVGGPRWLEAVALARQQVGESTDLDATQKSVQLERIDDDLKQWLLLERYDSREGAPAAVLAQTCRCVAEWAGKRSGAAELVSSAEAEMLRVLSSTAGALADLLKPLGQVGQTQLQRLMEQVVVGGCRNPAPVAEVGHLRRFHEPAAVVEPVDTLVWWDFCDASIPVLPLWTEDELRSLNGSGAEPLSAETILAQHNAAWMRALQAARTKLVLAFPRQRGGEPVHPHPLLAHLKALVEGQLPTVDVDACLRQGESIFELAELRHRPLPQPRRWWTLSKPELLTQRKEESFSSAEKFIFEPFAWVLSYKAGLRRGSLTQGRPSADVQVEGKLLHRLFDLLLVAAPAEFDWRSSNRERLEGFIAQQWLQLCEQQAAHLLLPGRLSGQEELLATAKEAMWRLFGHLRRAGVVEAHCNVAPAAAAFIGGMMAGFLDLLVKNEAGVWAVVDLKLGGLKRRQDELANNLQLQLAVYAFLHSHGSAGRWPEAAYYILNRAELIAQEADYFPGARVVPAKTLPTSATKCWDEFTQVWKWREELLRRGSVEVTVEGTEPTDESDETASSVPPVARWQRENVEPERNDFSALTGWREGR